MGGHLEERGAGGVGVGEEESALAEIVEGEGWEDEVEPCAADGAWAEVAHVSVEGFAASDGEEDAAEDDEAGVAAGCEEVPAVDGVEGGEDVGVGGEMGAAHGGECEEPEGGEGAEASADAVGAEELGGEEGDEDDGGDGDDEPLALDFPCGGGVRESGWGAEETAVFEAFDGAEDGDGRCDDAIAEEEGGSGEAEDDDAGSAAGLF